MALTSEDASAQAPSLPPTPAPRRPGLGGVLFRPPQPPSPQPSPSDLPESLSPAEPPAVSPSASGWPSEAPAGSSDDDPTSSGASTQTERVEPSPISKRAMRKLVHGGVIAAGSMAHDHLTVDELERSFDVYLFEEEEVEAIANPLANIAARRGGVAGAVGNPDVADAIAAMVGVAVYVSRQLALRVKVRKHRQAAQLEGGEVQTVPRDL